MALLLLNVSKAFGIAGIIAVAANTFAYFRIHRKKVFPVESTIDETHEVLANFFTDKDENGNGFFFAVSTSTSLENMQLDSLSARDEGTKPGFQNTEIQSEGPHGVETDVSGSRPDSDTPSNDTIDVEGVEKYVTQGKDSYEKIIDDWELLHPDQMVENEPKRGQATLISGLESTGFDAGQSHGSKPEDAEAILLSEGEKKLETPRERKWSVLRTGEDKREPALSKNSIHSLKEATNQEIILAKGTNASVLSMFVDWSKIMPEEPLTGLEASINDEALKYYRNTVERVTGQGMRVMVTLCHKSVPAWASAYGGWREEKTADYFLYYARRVVEKLHDLVDFWITFSELHPFALMVCSPHNKERPIQSVLALSRRAYKNIINRMIIAHKKVYDIIHDSSLTSTRKVFVGVSYNTSLVQPYGFFDISSVELNEWKKRLNQIYDVCDKLDFIGINYYGQKFVSLTGPKLVTNEEYSEDGIAIYPDGLYKVLLDFHERYKSLNIPFIITANGLVDGTDYLRKPFIVEHLVAVKAAMNRGVPVKGYCFCALSDYYGPVKGRIAKVGLVSAEYTGNLKFICHASYTLFSEIAKTGIITRCQREMAWSDLQYAISQLHQHKISYVLELTDAGEKLVSRSFVKKDWRVGHYTPEGLQDPFSRTIKCICSIPFNVLKNHKVQ